jgi:transposase
MLTLSNARIFLHQQATDMRKSFEGLCAQVEQSFSVEITSGSYFVFLNQRRDRIKVLYWDIDGLAIWYKRLEKGTFSRKEIQQTAISRKELLMLLEGISPKRIQPRYKLS